jgi:Mlc titration factor MtfA (ptsG expression regulator)
MRSFEPALYGELREFYHQDPAARSERYMALLARSGVDEATA